MLVIDGTGSMKIIIGDVKERMSRLVQAIHRLVPIARVGVVVFGGRGEKITVQPLTPSPATLNEFLQNLDAKNGAVWEEDLYGGVRTAIDSMNWNPRAKKVIVLVGDSPPHKEDLQPLLALIEKFRAEDGTLNTIDVTAEKHERFERDFWARVHHSEPPAISPLPAFYQQTRAAFKILAHTGGGAVRSLSKDAHINQQVLILAFGEEWQTQVAAFGRGISANGR